MKPYDPKAPFAGSTYFTFHGWRPARIGPTAKAQLHQWAEEGIVIRVLGYPNLKRLTDKTDVRTSYVYYGVLLRGTEYMVSTWRDLETLIAGYQIGIRKP